MTSPDVGFGLPRQNNSRVAINLNGVHRAPVSPFRCRHGCTYGTTILIAEGDPISTPGSAVIDQPGLLPFGGHGCGRSPRRPCHHGRCCTAGRTCTPPPCHSQLQIALPGPMRFLAVSSPTIFAKFHHTMFDERTGSVHRKGTKSSCGESSWAHACAALRMVQRGGRDHDHCSTWRKCHSALQKQVFHREVHDRGVFLDLRVARRALHWYRILRIALLCRLAWETGMSMSSEVSMQGTRQCPCTHVEVVLREPLHVHAQEARQAQEAISSASSLYVVVHALPIVLVQQLEHWHLRRRT